MKKEDFKLNKQYRRIAGESPEFIGDIYICKEVGEKIRLDNSKTGLHTYLAQWSTDKPENFVPLEPLEEEWETGDLLVFDMSCYGYIYIGRTTEDKIITLRNEVLISDYTKKDYLDLSCTQDVFIWRLNHEWKKYIKPEEPIEVVLTMKDIADKFNISIEQLKIKGEK